MMTLLLLVHATYMYGVVLHAHPVRGESHNQRNSTGEVATTLFNRSGSKRAEPPKFTINASSHDRVST